tara:strand:- start:10616 stop:10954 length:339 start_codon:yes stop_codon:yes gene_type:complete
MTLFPADLGNYDTGNPMLNFLSGFADGTSSTKANVKTLPPADQKKKDEEEEERKRKKREADNKKAMKEALPRRNTGAVGESTTSNTSPMDSYQGLGKNPNSQIKQYKGTIGL